ncbi:MAG: hypothetical protein E7436_03845 [Ruminococcaceae bacterium]|nr:hypothetical protein [Oscillospiraceae bacterium]
MEREEKTGSVSGQVITAAALVLVTVLITIVAIFIFNSMEHSEPAEPTTDVTDATEATALPTLAPTEPSLPLPTEPAPTAPSVPTEPAVTEPVAIDWDTLLNFQPVSDEVTAKERTNLRDIPSQGDDSRVLYTLTNGEIAVRIAISDYGWSKVVFNGQVYYAVSSYLTTDLTPPPYEIQTQFRDVYEYVTAKDAVNLRTLPSLTHEDCEVVAQLQHGQVIIRTGINTDVGWSRVEYNGQVLYCISSYLMTVETEPTEPTNPVAQTPAD